MLLRLRCEEECDEDAYRILMESLSKGFNFREVTCKPSEENH
jgi:hypothetical protein